jgi:hypothetical protein
MDKVSGLVNDGIPGHEYFKQGQREVIQFLRMEGFQPAESELDVH